LSHEITVERERERESKREKEREREKERDKFSRSLWKINFESFGHFITITSGMK
jgi:hypothetical protein